MANRIKGITVEIGGDTTKLQNALKQVNGEIKTTQSQLKDVDKFLKLDPGNTELLAQKHKLLGEAVEGTKEKLATLKTAAEQANTALANGEISKEQYDALQREIIETEQALKRLEEQANQSATAVQKIAATGENSKLLEATSLLPEKRCFRSLPLSQDLGLHRLRPLQTLSHPCPRFRQPWELPRMPCQQWMDSPSIRWTLCQNWQRRWVRKPPSQPVSVPRH